MSSQMDAVVSKDLVKVYDKGIRALDCVSLGIRRGEVFTLLGPNGAGKTTFLRILCTQLMPTSGDAWVLGHDVVSEPEKVRLQIAMVPQDAIAYGNYSPYDYAYHLSRLRGMPRETARMRALEALEEVAMTEIMDRPSQSLSGGEKRRGLIASALASDAEVLMLDEPSSGLDAIGRRKVWAALRTKASMGRTILLTTHMMEEAEMVSDRLAIIDKGQVIAVGTSEEIKGRMHLKYRVTAPSNAIDPSRYPEMAK
ncbi:MAG: ABC transporter ATP-binding protein, partial [Candidatus Thermoplasmatota archaeon]